VHFAREKLDQVEDIILLSTVKQLQPFLGLVNQFGFHVPNFAITAAPLYDYFMAKGRMVGHQ